MPVNLINEQDLNNYLTDIVYRGQKMEVFKSGEFKSTAFVEQNKDAIVRSILLQWFKHRLRSYFAEDLSEHRDFLTPVKVDEPNLPTWAKRCMTENRPIHRFETEKIPPHLTEHIGMIRDYLYATAESYVNKTLARVKDTNAKGKEVITPKLRIDYLKTQDSYNTFDKTLAEAEKWHSIMAEKAQHQKRNEKLYQKSLTGTQNILKLADGMEIVQLTTPEALDYESQYMGHCVGKGGYDADVQKGTIKIYSLRDADGMPHATFEVRTNKDTGKEEIIQCKGKGNKAPIIKYKPYIMDFIAEKDLEIVGDKQHLRGIIKQDGKCYDVFNLPPNFVIKGDLDLSCMELTELPDLSDVTIEGNFDCSHNDLTNLIGSPKKVGGKFACQENLLETLKGAEFTECDSFSCRENILTSLEFAPRVSTNFCCVGNELTSLKGAPQTLSGEFDCARNRLTNLVGAPQKVGSFRCSHNNLKTLKGAPQEVRENFVCMENNLISLKGAPQRIGRNFDCSDNSLKTLIGAPSFVGGNFFCDSNQLASLKGVPQVIGGYFNCCFNHLKSLQFCPLKIGGMFNASFNKLTSLQFGPQEVGGGYFCHNNQLKTLEGAPKRIPGNFECNDNPSLKSFKGGPAEVEIRFNCDNTSIETLDDAPQKIGEYLICNKILAQKYGKKLTDTQINQLLKRDWQTLLHEKQQKIRAKILRKILKNEAEKNVSSLEGEIKQKRTGKHKIAAQIRIAVAKIKQAWKERKE